MDNLQIQIEKKLEYYRNMLEKIRIQLSTAPSGRLVIKNCRKKYPQFYWSDKPEGSSHYKSKFISCKEKELIKKLAQKDYYQKLLVELEKQTEILSYFLNHYDSDAIKNIYFGISPKRQELITPVILPDDKFVQLWMEDYKGSQNTYPVSYDFITDKGEAVRSKSEKIIADCLSKRGIPYKYEQPLWLKSFNKMVYPDFYCLNVRTRKVYYWEHLGKMGQEEYVERNVKKLVEYQKEGIYPGESLLLTFENDVYALGQKTIDHMIENYLL